MYGMTAAVARAFRRAATPLFWYYALTIAVPLANGSAAATGFAAHAAIVVTLPLLLVAAGGAAEKALAAIGMDYRRGKG